MRLLHKLLLVAKETYIRQVKSWSFLFLVLSPFIFIGLSATISYFGAKMTPDDQIAIVSTDKTIQSQLKHHDTFTWKYKSVDDAKKAMKDDKIVGYVYIKSDSQKISANYYGNDEMSSTDEVKIRQILQSKQATLNIINAGLDKQQLQHLSIQPQYKKHIAKKAVDKKTVQSISYMILSFLMYIVILTYAATTAQEIAAEKGTKIMEMIFSSMPGGNYFDGKVLGIFLEILTQLLIYAVMFSGFYYMAPHIDGVKDTFAQIKSAIDQALGQIISWGLLFVVLGLILYIVYAAVCGAIVTKAEDANKAVQPLVYLTLLGLFSSMSLSNNPDGIFAMIMSYVPFLSSFLMPLRLIKGNATGLEAAISLIILFVFLLGSIWWIKKIYPSLILQTDDNGMWKNMKRALQGIKE